MRPLVIGVGNRWRTDDGIGPLVVEAMEAQGCDDVDLLVLDGEPARLVMAWEGRPPTGDEIPAFRRRVHYVQQTPFVTEERVATQLALPWTLHSATGRFDLTEDLVSVDRGFGAGASPIWRRAARAVPRPPPGHRPAGVTWRSCTTRFGRRVSAR